MTVPSYPATGDPPLDQELRELYRRIGRLEEAGDTRSFRTFHRQTKQQDVDLVGLGPVRLESVSAGPDHQWNALAYPNTVSPPTLGPALAGPIQILEVTAAVTSPLIPPDLGLEEWDPLGGGPFSLVFGLSFAPTGGGNPNYELGPATLIGFIYILGIEDTVIPEMPLDFSYFPQAEIHEEPLGGGFESRFPKRGGAGLSIAAGWLSKRISRPFISEWNHWKGEITCQVRFVDFVPNPEPLEIMPPGPFDGPYGPEAVAGPAVVVGA